MQEVRQHIALAAPYPVNVLAIGPIGLGKELIAKGIHKLLARSGSLSQYGKSSDPLKNCHERSFTSDKARKGKVEEAANGTLFLDEIGDMPFSLQAKLLRVLETKTVQKIGSENRSLISVWFARPTQILVNWHGKANSEPICSIGSRFILLKIRHWLNAPKIWKS